MDYLYQDIGRRISQLRKSHKITQEKLAEELDITTKHISAVERGVSSLSLEKTIDVCDILDCTLDYLILGEDYDNPSNKLPTTILNILNSQNTNEISLLMEYLNLYCKIRDSRTETLE